MGKFLPVLLVLCTMYTVQSTELYEYIKCQLCETHAPSGQIDDCCCDVETVDQANSRHFLPILHNLTKSTYFRYFQVDLYRDCAIWSNNAEDMLCFRRDCSIAECEPDEIPTCWKQDNQDKQDKDTEEVRPHARNTPPSSLLPPDQAIIDTLSRIDLNTSSSTDRTQMAQTSLPYAWIRDYPLSETMDNDGGIIGNGRYDKKNIWGMTTTPTVTDTATSSDDSNDNALFINLLMNPEGYSGYDGLKIWEAIYKENCFNHHNGDKNNDGTSSSSSSSLDGMCFEERVLYRLLSGLHTSINTHIAMTYNEGKGYLGSDDLYQSIDNSNHNHNPQQQPLWSWIQDQWVTYTGGLGGLTRRSSPEAFTPGSTVSTTSSSTGTVNDNTPSSVTPTTTVSIDRLTLTPNLVPSVPLYIQRIGKYPERIKNLYFTYLFIVRAVAKATPALLRLNLTTGATFEDKVTSTLLQQLLKVEIPSVVQGFDETAMFRVRKEELLDTCPPILHGLEDLHDLQQRYIARAQEKTLLMEQFRDKFQNISRILDCVGCEKCRLWGKLQFLGIGTALKILFADADTIAPLSSSSSKPTSLDLHLTRNEAVALINVLHRLSMSISAVQVMRDLEVQSKLKYYFSLIGSGVLVIVVSVLFVYCWYCGRCGGRKKPTKNDEFANTIGKDTNGTTGSTNGKNNDKKNR